MITPHIYSEVGPEFHHIAGMLELFEWVPERDRYLFLKKWDFYGKIKHPIDWIQPTRLMWCASFVKKFTYRPVNEDFDRALDYGSPDVKRISGALSSLYETGDSAFPALESLCIDLRDWKPTVDVRSGSGIHWGSDELGYGVSWDEDGYYFENPDIDEYGNLNPDFARGVLINEFLEHISHSISPRLICLNSHTVTLYGGIPLLTSFYADTIVIHDFGATFYEDGLPECGTLIIDWHEAYGDAKSRLEFIDSLLVSEEGYPMLDMTNRILFTRTAGPKRYRKDSRKIKASNRKLREIEDAKFAAGMDEMLKDLEDESGEESTLEWAFIEDDQYPLGPGCKGCGRQRGHGHPKV